MKFIGIRVTTPAGPNNNTGPKFPAASCDGIAAVNESIPPIDCAAKAKTQAARPESRSALIVSETHCLEFEIPWPGAIT
jgi:hypothetical protein